MLDLLLAWILGLQQACLRFPEWSIPNRWLLLFDSVIGTSPIDSRWNVWACLGAPSYAAHTCFAYAERDSLYGHQLSFTITLMAHITAVGLLQCETKYCTHRAGARAQLRTPLIDEPKSSTCGRDRLSFSVLQALPRNTPCTFVASGGRVQLNGLRVEVRTSLPF
jgi:hypothetical protein